MDRLPELESRESPAFTTTGTVNSNTEVGSTSAVDAGSPMHGTSLKSIPHSSVLSNSPRPYHNLAASSEIVLGSTDSLLTGDNQNEKLYNSVESNFSNGCQVEALDDQAILCQTQALSILGTCLDHQPLPEAKPFSSPPTLDRVPEQSERCESGLLQVDSLPSITSAQIQLREHPSSPPKEQSFHSSRDKSSRPSLSRKRAAEQTPDGNKRPQKRRRKQNAHENDGDEGCRPDGEDAIIQKSHEGKEFACPYYRFDPVGHINCISLKLNRIQAVKQHLRRRHTPERSPAPSQINEFRVSLDNVNGVSENAQGLLGRRMDRMLQPAEQWYTIWDILFEDKPRPKNPHLGSVVEEAIGIIRDFWALESERIISSFAEKKELNLSDVQQLVTRTLDEIRANLDQKPGFSDSSQTSDASWDSTASFIQPWNEQEPFTFYGDFPSSPVDSLHDDSTMQSRQSTPLSMWGSTDESPLSFYANHQMSGIESVNPDSIVSIQPDNTLEILFSTSNYEGWASFRSSSIDDPTDIDFVDGKNTDAKNMLLPENPALETWTLNLSQEARMLDYKT